MITDKYSIRFEFMMEPTRPNIQLEADVERHHSEIYFIVRNFRGAGQPPSTHSVLPEISIRKKEGCWVHTDSGKETHLSQAVGKAIDASGSQ